MPEIHLQRVRRGTHRENGNYVSSRTGSVTMATEGSLVGLELSVGEPDLLSWLEGRHSQIRTAGTAECIT